MPGNASVVVIVCDRVLRTRTSGTLERGCALSSHKIWFISRSISGRCYCNGNSPSQFWCIWRKWRVVRL